MTLTRDLSETEYLVALVAGQIAAQAPGFPPDIAVSVGTAERICEEIIQRKDNPDYPAELDPGAIWIDEYSSQRNDGGDKRMGIHVEWKRGGLAGNTLTPEESTELMGRIVKVVEEWADERGSKFTVLYDNDDPFVSDE